MRSLVLRSLPAILRQENLSPRAHEDQPLEDPIIRLQILQLQKYIRNRSQDAHDTSRLQNQVQNMQEAGLTHAKSFAKPHQGEMPDLQAASFQAEFTESHQNS